MIEVEIRARVQNVDKLLDNLTKIGAKKVNSKRQVDRIFGHSKFLDDNSMIIEGGLSARIRSEDDNIALEFKEISRKSGGLELSTKLNKVETGLFFLNKLGFVEAFIIDKKRDIYSYNGFTICIDNVKNLGTFIEIEKIIESESLKSKVREECMKILGFLVPSSEVENKKYGDLMQEIINGG